MDIQEIFYQLITIPSITDSARESEPIVVIKQILAEHTIKYSVIGHGSKTNLVAETGNGQRSIVLNSHFDVVQAEDALFVPHIKDGKLYARGAADAKGALAAMLIAFIQLSQEKLKGKVILHCVCDEENAGEKGSKLLVEKDMHSDAVIVGEPTNLNIVSAEKGFLRLSIKIIGQEHHAAFPKRESNAISLAAKVISALENLNFTEKHSLLSKPTLSLGIIEGGKKINVAAGECVLGLDIRYLPQQSEDKLIDEIKKVINPICRNRITVIESGSPFETDPNAILVKIAKRVLGTDIVGVNFGTDGRFYKGSDIIVLGPGKSDVAHNEDEHILLRDISHAAVSYKEIVKKYLEANK